MRKKKFIRRTWYRYAKIGKGRKKKLRWKKPTGRDNNMREKKRGYSPVVSIGYRSNKDERGKINGKMPLIVKNVNDLESIKENNIAVIAGVGKKKKIEIAEKAKAKGIEIANLNAKKYLKENEKKSGVKDDKSK